jgi:hypothetical protein
MNKRIKELAEQAGHRFIPSSNSGPLRVECLTPELEKFAELIVKDCCQFNYDFLESYREASEVNSKIRKHFGVEK